MRILLSFAVACLLLVGWAAWQLLPAQPTVRPFVPAPVDFQSTAIPADDPAPATEDEPPAPDLPGDFDPLPEVPSPGPRSTGLVHWALPAGYESALRTVQLTQETLRTEPHHVDALRDQARALLVLRRWPEATVTLGRYLELVPADAELRYELAAALMRQQRWNEALAVWRTLASQTPDDARCWFNLAVSHQALGHLADALGAWNEAVRRAPTAAALARRGEVLLDLHEWEAAAGDFAQVLAAEPNADDALLNLSLALRAAGRAAEAVERLRKFVAAHPQHVPALNSLAETAWVLASVEDRNRGEWREEARRCWEASLALDPTQDGVRERLAEVRAVP